MTSFLKENYQGILGATALGLIAHFVAPYIPKINGVVLAFLIAVIVGNLFSIPTSFKKGIKFSSSKVLEVAIIFLAFSISFSHIATLGISTFLAVIAIVTTVLGATLLLAKRFSPQNSTAWLVGFGTAICGSSAIAAAAPMLSKNKEDAGIAIAVVNLLGSIGMIALPFLLGFVEISEETSGFLLGGTLQSVGNVTGAAYALSDNIGELAITVKLTRVALLSPGVIVFAFLAKRNQTGQNESTKIKFQLPYYLWLFIAITILNSFIEIPPTIIEYLKLIGKLLLTISMAAIGLKVSFKTLFQSGKMAIGFGAVIFLIQIGITLLFLMIL